MSAEQNKSAKLEGAGGEWEIKSLNELIDIKHGFAFKGEFIHDYPKGDILLTPGNFAIGGGFKSDKLKYYDGLVPEDFILNEGDLIVTMTDLSKQADTLGYPAIVPFGCDRRYLHNQRIGKIILKSPNKIDKKFLHYLLCHHSYRNEILASATGTTVKHTSPERIKRFRFCLPPMNEQKAIAHILGTLDDKIELNRRTNETLETMAQALFKFWFVDFGPVRAKMEGRWRRGQSLPSLPAHLFDLFPDRLVDSELGEIPEGWEVGTLGDLAKIVSGKRPPLQSLKHHANFKISLWGGNGPMAFVKEPLFQCPILLTGRVGTLGSVFRVKTPCWPSDNTLIVITHNDITYEFLYFQMKLIDYKSLNRGSTQPLLTQSDLKNQVLIHPTKSILQYFHIIINNIFLCMDNFDNISHTLTILRDTLLPKLISGELRVKQTREE